MIEGDILENWVSVISGLGYPVAVSVITIGFVFKMVMDEREVLINIDEMIIKDCRGLSMQVY